MGKKKKKKETERERSGEFFGKQSAFSKETNQKM